MSNTAEVTPYVEDYNTSQNQAVPAIAALLGDLAATAAYGAVGAATAGIEAVGSVVRETDEERANRERRNATRAAALVQEAKVAALRLRQRDPAALRAAAERLGYRVRKANSADAVALTRPDGMVLAISRSQGSLDIASNAGETALHSVVREATLAQAKAHQEKFAGSGVRVRTLADRRIEVAASEPAGAHPDGRATVTVQVDAKGNAQVDVDGIRGNRCERVLEELARALGGQARNKRIKPAYYDDVKTDAPRVRTRG
jgi:hypothetical protein